MSKGRRKAPVAAFDLSIYESKRCKKPNPTRHDRKHANRPKEIHIFATDVHSGVKLKSFTTEWVYFSFLSEKGCALHLTYTGHDEHRSKGHRALTGAQALANFKSKLAVTYDENAPDAIPKDDPYYVEMLKRTNGYQRRLRDSRSSSGHMSLFNHPLLKFYHERSASQRKESLDEANYKLRLFQLIKWDRIKQMKQEVNE